MEGRIRRAGGTLPKKVAQAIAITAILVSVAAITVPVVLDSVSFGAPTTFDVDGIRYTVTKDAVDGNPGEATVSSMVNTGMTKVTLADTVGSSPRYIVTGINENVFKNKTSITEVTLPSGLKTIGKYAFSGCTNMKIAAAGILPASVTSVGNNAFENCTELTGKLVIPASVSKLSPNAFAKCGITELDLGSVTEIGDAAFRGCTALKGKLVIPASVTEVGSYIFANCSGIEELDWSSSANIGNRAFLECKSLTNTVISANVKKIIQYAFCDCTYMTLPSGLPASLETIEPFAFYQCYGIGTINYPAGLTSVGEKAFYKCNNLNFNSAA